MRWFLLAAVSLLVVTGLAGAVVWTRDGRDESVVVAEPPPPAVEVEAAGPSGFHEQGAPRKPVPRPRKPPREGVVWPTFGGDVARTRSAARFPYRPPYRRVWTRFTRANIEFAPVVAYGRLYVGNQAGRFFALNGENGRTSWQHRFGRCIASSPTVGKGVVYQGLRGGYPCARGGHAGATGEMVAMSAGSGHIRWRFATGAIESSPALVGNLLYFGTWSRRVYALNVKTARPRWTSAVNSEVHGAPAVAGGSVYVTTTAGSLYAFDRMTGRLRWQRSDGTEAFYAGPTVAKGRVYAANTNGTVYAYSARTGGLLWARRVGTYVYTNPAVVHGRVFVGTYSGSFLALDARTGSVRWSYPAAGAVHGAPVVMGGLVYFSTCRRCAYGGAKRYVKSGPRETYALDVRNGHRVWSLDGVGGYSPLVPDKRRRVYLLGAAHVFALRPRHR